MDFQSWVSDIIVVVYQIRIQKHIVVQFHLVLSTSTYTEVRQTETSSKFLHSMKAKPKIFSSDIPLLIQPYPSLLSPAARHHGQDRDFADFTDAQSEMLPYGTFSGRMKASRAQGEKLQLGAIIFTVWHVFPPNRRITG